MFTKVYLLRISLERDYKHTLYFANAGTQTEYMLARRTHSFEDFTYQKKDSVIRIPLAYDEAIKSNYVMYQNGGKWYYCFITNYEFKNDDQTDITIETDVLQTYMFDYSVLASFVEREHTDDDTVGLHTVPENLEVGEYICQHREEVDELKQCSMIMGFTRTVDDQNVVGNRYNGIYSGIRYAVFSMDKNSDLGDQIDTLNGIIGRYDKGSADAIKCLFLYPSTFVTIKNGDSNWSIEPSDVPKSINKIFDQSSNDNENAYVPKNNKLLTFPYHYLLVSNNNGGSAIYQFELFDTGTVQFNIKACITPGGSIRMIPINYKGQNQNHEEGINLGKYPVCNWTSDEYTNWLTQNSVNIGMNIAGGVGQVIGGVALTAATSGAALIAGSGGMIVGGVSSVAGQLAQVHQMSFTPPQSRGNINCGDVVAAANTNTFYLQHMRIKDEYAMMIDNYFSMFGYKCNRVKIPNTNHRSRWWFTKTIDVNIACLNPIPQTDVEKIKSCYNNGVTFWKNNIKNYSGADGLFDNPITTS